MLTRVAAPPAPAPVGGGLMQSASWLDWSVMSACLCLLSGLVMLAWGLWNLRSRNRKIVLRQLCLCPLPVVGTVLACGPILLGLSDGGTARASTVVVAFICGVVGALSGFLSAVLAVIQLRRIDSSG